MFKLLVILTIISPLLIFCNANFETPNFNFNYSITNTEITLTIISKNQGWVGFGFGSSMKSAELFVCNYTEEMQFKIFHFNSVNEETPHIINDQPVFLLSGFRNKTHTSCTFQRSLFAFNNKSIEIDLLNPMSIVYAYGDSDAFEYHSERGTNNFSFFACEEYCENCDYYNKKCLTCRSPAINISSICQISLEISTAFSLSYYLFNKNSNISFTITAQNQGWVALGLGESMQGADIFMCNSSETDKWQVFELKSITEEKPSLDAIQNVYLIQASRNSTHTTCTFTRRLKSEDITDREIFLGNNTNIIYAYGDSDVFKYHKDRGISTIAIQTDFDFNNNDTLCIQGTEQGCSRCKYENFEPGVNGECQEMFRKENSQYINENLTVFYYIEDQNMLTITLVAKSQGWIAIGLGDSMFQADIFMCHLNTSNNLWEAFELKSSAETEPLQDEIQNILLLSAMRNATHTVCTFQRNLKTNDSTDTFIAVNQTISMIYALGETDVFEYHQNRGQFNMIFSNNPQPICDDLCLKCEMDGICSECKYGNFFIINGICKENFEKEIAILKNDNFSLYYYLFNSSYISFTLISNENGWLALGLASHDNSLNDLFVCNFVNNTWGVSEYKYNDTFIEKDQIQNADLLYGIRNSTNSLCAFGRPLKTNDSSDIQIEINKIINISYGYDNVDSFQNFHAKGLINVSISNESFVCPLEICNSCSVDNKTCLQCKYSNYLLENGLCVENFAIEKPVTLSQNFSLFYYIDEDSIFFSLISRSQGWISLGLGSSMLSADIFMCNQSVEGKWQIYDMTAKREGTPTMDAIQNLEFLQANRNETHTLCSFRRKLITNDTTDKNITENSFNDVIYAMGSSDKFSYHIERGISSINFTSSNESSICPIGCSKCDSNSQCIKCSGDSFVVINGVCKQNNLEMLPSSAKILDNYLYLYWNFTEDNNSVQLMIKTSNTGYVALGIGDCMDNCDINVVEYDQNGNIKLLDMFSKGEVFPSNDVDLGGNFDLNLLGYGQIDGFMYVKYSRKINTGDKWDFILNQGDHEMSYAFSNGKNLEYHHGNKGKFQIHFVQGYNGNVIIEDIFALTKLHGILTFVAWGGLIDVALFFGRYLKTFKFYIEFHGIIMLGVCILSVVMESLMIYKHRQDLANLDGEQQLVVAHFIIGVILIAMFLFEIFLGFIAKFLIEKKNKFIDNTTYKWMHRVNGILIYLLAKANIGIGIKLFKDSLLIPLIIYYIVLFLVKAAIEIFFLLEMKFLTSIPTIAKKEKLLVDDLVTKINQNSKIKKIQQNINSMTLFKVPRDILITEIPNLTWIILDSNIYDITDFRHPGGNYIIERIKGREIGRFFYGVIGLENLPLSPHKHSLYALNYLNPRLIGKYENKSHQIFINKNNPNALINEKTWRISEKLDLSANISIFRFRTENLVIKNYIPGVEWMGKHFKIQGDTTKNKLTRLYTCLICYSHQNVEIRKKIINYFENSSKEEKSDFDFDNQKKDMSLYEKSSMNLKDAEELTLMIKKYNKPRAFSNYIHSNIHDNFLIEGSFGSGLELSKNISGAHYIIAAGTGILPFLDLLDYLLKKALFAPHNDKKLVLPSTFNFYEEDYLGTFNNDFKLILFASFANDDEFIGSDIIISLYQVVKKKNLDFFDMKLRISDKNTKFKDLPLINGYFDASFLTNNIANYGNLKKIFICGPPAMNQKIYEDLQRNHFNEDKLHFV